MNTQTIAVLKAINYEGIENNLWSLEENKVTVSHYTGSDVDSIIDLEPHIAVWYKDGMYTLGTEEMLRSAPTTLSVDGWSIAIFPINIENE